MNFRKVSLLRLALALVTSAGAPQTAATLVAASAPTAVPSLVPDTGVALGGEGKPLAGETGVTFQIYKEETAEEPLWVETQSVAIDPTGHYKVQLGANTPNGLPQNLFTKWRDWRT